VAKDFITVFNLVSGDLSMMSVISRELGALRPYQNYNNNTLERTPPKTTSPTENTSGDTPP